VIAGSTRMKAGTAQKLVLNSLSTTVMVLLGASSELRSRLVDRLGAGWGPTTRVKDPAQGTLILAQRLLE
jgi:hypothetical protein